jgi:PAS domain-containing protein
VIASSDPRNIGLQDHTARVLSGGRSGLAAIAHRPPWVGRDLANAPEHGEPPPPGRGLHSGHAPGRTQRQPCWWLAALNPDDFINHFSQLLPVEEGRVQLLRYDGTLLLSLDQSRRHPRTLGSGRRGSRTRLEQQELGELEQHWPDGHQTLTAYRASSRYPAVIAVHLDRGYIPGAVAGGRAPAVDDRRAHPGRAVGRHPAALAAPPRLEQQRAELEQQRRLTSSVFEASSDAIMLTTPSGEILSTNPAFERMTGYSGAEARGRNPRLLASGQHDTDLLSRSLGRRHHPVTGAARSSTAVGMASSTPDS